MHQYMFTVGNLSHFNFICPTFSRDIIPLRGAVRTFGYFHLKFGPRVE